MLKLHCKVNEASVNEKIVAYGYTPFKQKDITIIGVRSIKLPS
jgi:hypothetical protein